MGKVMKHCSAKLYEYIYTLVYNVSLPLEGRLTMEVKQGLLGDRVKLPLVNQFSTLVYLD